MPLVSVIIPTYNRAALLREAIESVLAVDRRGFELEVIVVDDGSTDETPEVCRAYPIRYIRTEMCGASAARNTGIEAASGEFIAFLDDDDVWLSGNIAPQLRAFETHPEYGAVFARIQLTDANRVPYGALIPPDPKPSGWIFEDLLTYWPQLGCVVVRASVAREIGPFDPSLISEEDWDWLLRIARRYPIGRIEDVAVLFRQRGDADETLSWSRFPHSLRAFSRHTQHYAPYKRLQLQRIIWAHRGAYAAEFLDHAHQHILRGDRSRALRCVKYAVLASPIHTVVLLARQTVARVNGGKDVAHSR
ncbi:MAG TPA: glycosyltransferase family A protein [Ktedonobacterales bacterium]